MSLIYAEQIKVFVLGKCCARKRFVNESFLSLSISTMTFHFHFSETAKEMKTMKEEQRAMIAFKLLHIARVQHVQHGLHFPPTLEKSNLQTARKALAVRC